MIVLDSNVLSELMRPKPAVAVLRWLDRQAPDDVWTTSVNIVEIQRGIELAPTSARRWALAQKFAVALSDNLRGRVLPLDEESALEAALVAARRQRLGRRIEIPDAMIAGIARSHGAALATRDTDDFADIDLTVINPWTA